MSRSLIADRYDLSDRLGSGGMSTVYRATDRVLERTVAVKILAEHLSDDDKFIARFRREALAVAKLIHPNIVQVYDTGVDGDRHFIVMEYVEGRSGAQLLQTRGKIGPEHAVEIGVQACAGLDYAHKQGIIHRDVKPGNLMVIGGPAGRGASFGAHEPPTNEMTVKLTDFGIARAAEQTRLTQVGSVVGTAAYLSPELARGEEPTPAADVYALGVVIYQLLTARLPWEGTTLAELAMRRENESPLPPTSYDSSVPETLSRAVLTALAGDPAARYSTARSLSRALRAGVAGSAPPPPDAGEAPTRSLGASSATTRVLGGEEPVTPAVRSAPPPPRSRPAPAPRAAPASRPSAGRRFARFLAFVVLILVLAAIIAAVVIALTDSASNTSVGQFLRTNVRDQVETVIQFVKDHTGG
jgi:eukaryotic-like serine/threonine-protein kinase